MASIRVVLKKKKNSKGLYPLAIRITKNRKSSFIYTGQYIDLKYWDKINHRVKKSHPNSSRLNNFLTAKLSEANNNLLEVESKNEIATAGGITQKIKKSNTPISFFSLAEKYIVELEAKGKFNRTGAEKPRIKHFKAFLKGKDITFPEISEILLKKFASYLKVKRNISDRTVINHLIVIRTIFNIAIREGLVDRKYYPFGIGKIVIKFPQSIKIGLSHEEISLLETVDLSDYNAGWHARNIWLFSFYFAGMRISDVLRTRWSDFKDGRLYYKMGKNNKVLSMKTPRKASFIIEQYRPEKRSNDDFLFPELKIANMDAPQDVQRKIANSTKKFNKHLRRVALQLDIDKPLTTHIARHTFGNISGDKIPVQMLQKLYRHSDITTTINYQRSFIFKDADDALDEVLDF